MSCSLYMPTQAVIQLQGFTASEKSHPSKQISRGHIRSMQNLMVDLFGGKSNDTLSSTAQ